MTTQQTFAFSNIPMVERQDKPRNRGLTMMLDWGIPLHQQVDVTEAQGHIVDEVKIVAGIPRVMPHGFLKKKITAYVAEGILVYPGGLFAEAAIKHNSYEPFLEHAIELGFSAIEISDQAIEIDAAEKKRLIRKAVEEYQLMVVGETGQKEGNMTLSQLIEDVENCLESGASRVLLESYELFRGEIRSDDIDALINRVPQDKLMFELPVTVLPGMSKDFKAKITLWIIKQFGKDINLGNVEWDEVYFTEMLRRQLI